VSRAAAEARRAAVLGTVTGARTFLAPAALALRGRLGDGKLGKVAKLALPALAAGEVVGDKLPMAPPRVEGPGLVGRVVSGALSGRVVGGARGARVGATFALASTYPSQLLRSTIVTHTPIPDLACAVPEDLAGATLAAKASDVDGPKTADIERFSAHQPEALAAGALGVAAAVVGTAAMTSAQYWVYGLFGGEASEAPADVGERILGKLGVQVKAERRPALNGAMHVLYGSSWGLPFGLAFGRGRPAGPAKGLAFGATVWLASLVELPALGVAAPAWKQPPEALARDLGFHLVYGAATAAAYEAFTA
jgi:uncharacterized membrane protein